MSLARTTDDLSETDIHDVLRNDRRRNVFTHLLDSGGEAELRDLAERIATEETGERPPPTNIRKSVYNSLHQTHLPKLDRLGAVEYDKQRKTVSLQEEAIDINRYMEVSTRFGVTWGEFYRSLSTVALLLIVFAQIGVPGVSAVPSLLWASVALAAIAITTVVQLWRNRWLYLQRLA
jgi:hypothetical protein